MIESSRNAKQRESCQTNPLRAQWPPRVRTQPVPPTPMWPVEIDCFALFDCEFHCKKSLETWCQQLCDGVCVMKIGDNRARRARRALKSSVVLHYSARIYIILLNNKIALLTLTATGATVRGCGDQYLDVASSHLLHGMMAVENALHAWHEDEGIVRKSYCRV